MAEGCTDCLGWGFDSAVSPWYVDPTYPSNNAADPVLQLSAGSLVVNVTNMNSTANRRAGIAVPICAPHFATLTGWTLSMRLYFASYLYGNTSAVALVGSAIIPFDLGGHCGNMMGGQWQNWSVTLTDLTIGVNTVYVIFGTGSSDCGEYDYTGKIYIDNITLTPP
jgi:hypothetical protein